ncbi:MAG: hypothetical protein AB8B91_20770 [Rubripirellula sp.]
MKSNSGKRGSAKFVLLGLAGLFLLGAVAYWFGSGGQRGGEVAKNFEPLPDAPSTDPIDKIAQQFVAAARVRDVNVALKLIDRDLFYQRLHGEEGSYEAARYDLKAEEVLRHLGRYSLDAMTTHGGRRLWDVLGKTTYSGLNARVVRYYVEPMAAFEVLDDDQLLDDLAGMISQDEFNRAAPELTDFQNLGSTKFGSRHSIDTNRALTPRFGYALLVFDRNAIGQPAICDVVDLLSLRGMSRTAGARFAEDHHFFGYQFSDNEHRHKQAQHSLYGDVPLGVPIHGPMLGFGKSIQSGGASKAEDELAKSPHSRPHYLATVASAIYSEPELLAERVDRFHQKFPGDPGAELTILLHVMVADEPRMNARYTRSIIDAASKLHAAWNDPFMLSIQALAAAEDGDVAAERRLSLQAKQAGFESATIYQTLLREAGEKQDKAAALELLGELNRYWTQTPSTPNDKNAKKFARLWEAAEQKANPPAEPEPEAAAQQSSRHPFGQPAPRMEAPERNSASRPENRFGPPAFGPTFGPQGGGRPDGFRGGPPSGRAGGFRGGPRKPPEPGPGVVRFIITGATGVRLGDVMQSLRAAGMSQIGGSLSNGNGYIYANFDGPLEDAKAMVHFGTVTSVDEAKRFIHVDCSGKK